MEAVKEWINLVDGIVAAVLVLGLFGGVRRGLSGELLRIITIVIALLVGWYGADTGAAWLDDHTELPPDDARVVALLGLIVGTYVVLGIVRHVFRIILDFSFRGRLEILGGGFLGLLRASVFSAMALVGASLVPSPAVDAALHASRSGTWAIDHLTPAYLSWAEQHPGLKLPTREQPVPDIELPDFPVDAPAIETVIESKPLGPLIDSTDEFLEE